jgi:prevent-host-death family protein
MADERVGTHEAKTHLSEYINRVRYWGERILIERHGKPVAVLVSPGTLLAWSLLPRASRRGTGRPLRRPVSG